MKVMASKGDYTCVLLDPASDLEIYAQAQLLCYTDKVVNPSVDDAGAQETVRAARSQGSEYWRPKFEEEGAQNFVLLKRGQNDKQEIAGVTRVVFPSCDNDYTKPLMCSAHILHRHRGQGLVSLLIQASVKRISDETNYNDIHVLAHKDNEPSIRGLKRQGFFVLKRGQPYITFMGRLQMLMPSQGQNEPEQRVSVAEFNFG